MIVLLIAASRRLKRGPVTWSRIAVTLEQSLGKGLVQSCGGCRRRVLMSAQYDLRQRFSFRPGAQALPC